ncbi:MULTISPECIES: HK97-gp10 family putative phage morphogenesis protein [Pseudomonas]|uniref:HK97-gp10 family putative phage morphogenesis protein n=1 Tax=Pseudomonas TaxID=286 RepID=UPI0008C3BEF2|nr:MULTISPECIES: HK97-gp10 family putative phage morphogenesis protein [Pseudomonas]SEO42714.1 phage protein, HK97 gp10 family [Pseudomonas sp. Snoq117.2]
MARRSRVIGDFKLRRTLRNIHQTMDNQLRPAMQKSADQILETMRELIPRDTGAAAEALEAFVARSGLDAQVGIRGKKNNRKFFYLKFIEYGTKGYTGGKRSGNRNRRDTVKTDGTHWFGKHPDIPARPAHPWLRPAIQVNREVVLANIAGAINETLQRAANNA